MQQNPNHTFIANRGVVIGGLVLDIQVRQIPGGVGRNIAEGIARLLPSCLPFLIGVIGCDAAGTTLLASMQSLSMPTDGIIQCEDVATPCVSVVLESGGEVAAAVADVTAMETHLTHQRLREMAPLIQQAALVVVDANLTSASMEAACQLATARQATVLLEPVSVAKAARCAAVLRYAHFVTPNAAELVAIAAELAELQGLPRLALPVGTEGPGSTAQEQIQRLLPWLRLVLAAGVKHVVLTLGSKGAALISWGSSGNTIEAVHVAALPCTIASLTGAGDTLVAGMAAALLQGKAPHEALVHGVAAASFSVESTSNVPEHMTSEALRQRAAEAERGMTTLRFAAGAEPRKHIKSRL